jgi:tetratricopeptide (TPR) repeat protein
MLSGSLAPLAGTAGGTRLSKKARWIAAASVVVLSGVVGSVIFRPGEKASAPGTEASAKSIAVMYFENRTGEKDLDRILVDMLITNLGRNKLITVVSGQRLFDVLKSMGKQDVAIDRSTATEAAKLAGAKTMLLGSIWSVGGKLNVTGQLLDVASGSVINSDRVEASKAEEVFAVADRLTEKVNEWLKGSPTEALRIGDATTSSYDAYRSYEQGMRHIYRFEFPEAVRSFQAAIQRDTAFALAHLRLSMVLGATQMFSNRPPASLSRARESVLKAERYAGNLSERDRGMISAGSAFLRRDYDAADGILKQLAANFPDDPEVWFLSAWLPLARGKVDEGIFALERAIEADRASANAYNMLGYSYCLLGQYEKAFSAIRTYMALIPDAWNPYDSGCDVYMMAGRFDEALKIAEEGLKRVPDWTESFDRQAQAYLLMHEPEKARERLAQFVRVDPGSLEYAERERSISFSFEGRMRESIEVLRSSLERTRSKDAKADELLAHFYLARMLKEQDRIDDALKELEAVRSLSREVRKDPQNPWPLVCDYWSGLCLTSHGEYKKAESSASAIRSAAETTIGDAHFLLYYHALRADMLLSQGKPREAMSSLEKVLPLTRMAFPPIRMLDAKVSVELGDRTRAVQLYEGFRNLTWALGPPSGDFLEFWIEQAKLDYYEGRMYERLGEKAQAVSFFQKALANWGNADKDYPPYVDARERLTNLMK